MALSKEKQLHQETQELRHSEAISTQWWQLHSLRLPMFLLTLLIWCSIERGSVFLPRCRQSLSYPRIASSLSHNATTYRMSVPPWATNLDSVSNSFTFLRQQSLADNRCSCFTRIDANISQKLFQHFQNEYIFKEKQAWVNASVNGSGQFRGEPHSFLRLCRETTGRCIGWQIRDLPLLSKEKN